jgi:hypothetical protein
LSFAFVNLYPEILINDIVRAGVLADEQLRLLETGLAVEMDLVAVHQDGLFSGEA